MQYYEHVYASPLPLQEAPLTSTATELHICIRLIYFVKCKVYYVKCFVNAIAIEHSQSDAKVHP